MAKIDRIKLTGFKSFERLDLVIDSINILVGGNGAGKTNFIKLFHLLSEMVAGRFQVAIEDLGGAGQIPYGGSKRTESISIDLKFGANGYQSTWKPSADDRMIITDENSLWYNKEYNRPYEEHIGSGLKESGLPTHDKKVSRYVLDSMRQWRVYHFHETSDSEKVKAHGDVHDDQILAPDARNIAAFLHRLANSDDAVDKASYQKIRKTIRLVAPFFDDFVLKPNKKEQILLRWSDRSSDQIFGPNAISDGTLRFICLTTLLLQPQPPTTVLIDEPELGLHPYAINVLSGLIRSASHRSQVIVTTQSVPLVNQFEFKDLIIVDRNQGPSIARRLKDDEIQGWLKEYDGYGLGDLWEKNLIGGRP